MSASPSDNRQRRTADLFRMLAEVALVLAIVSQAAAAARQSQAAAAKSFEAAREATAKQPGSGEAATIHLIAGAPTTMQLGSRTVPLEEALASGITAPRIVIRLQGVAFEQLADYCRTNEIPISIEATR